ncbi:hypothetical protein BB561_000423 [Smittium simulii]|uniref:Scamp-domain-containing protein n=1 Tax=Smittium simulii TaxID=133385 RepID=A0A2T9YZK3_9FUNG|nr:hypothetical protein BB561_000423 [Smittium simulii]
MDQTNQNPFRENLPQTHTSERNYSSANVEVDYNNNQEFNSPSFLNTPLIAMPEPRLNSHELTDFKSGSFQNNPSAPNPATVDGEALEYKINLDKRERDLRERERNLEAQARVLEEQRIQLQERADHISAIPSGFRPANNFPFFYPIMYHNIQDEIGSTDQKAVQLLYKEWLSLLVALLFNFITALVCMLTFDNKTSNAGDSFGGSLIYCFTIPICSFFLWYRPVYNAYMKDSALFFVIFFIFNGFHVLFSFYMSVGIPQSGSSALIYLIRSISAGHIIGIIFTSITTVLWFAHSFYALSLFKKTYSHYKNRGHSFSEAKSQAYVGFASNATVQSAAVNMATR